MSHSFSISEVYPLSVAVVCPLDILFSQCGVAGVEADYVPAFRHDAIDSVECTAPDVSVPVFCKSAYHIAGKAVIDCMSAVSTTFLVPDEETVVSSYYYRTVRCFLQGIAYRNVQCRVCCYIQEFPFPDVIARRTQEVAYP